MIARHRPIAIDAGVTALEITLIVSIIAVLAGVALHWRYRNYLSGFTSGGPGHRITATEAKINTLVAGLLTYQNNNNGILPSTEQGLRALVEKPVSNLEPRRWEKVAEDCNLIDAWGTPMTYISPARTGEDEFEVISAGPDKKMNTADDISSASFK